MGGARERAFTASAREDARSTHLVCIKQPDGGCVLAHRDRLTIVPALRCKRVDESGAGDAFTAAFAVALLERRPVRTAACFAAAAAQISMSRPGGQESCPGRTDIDARLPLLLACANGLQPA